MATYTPQTRIDGPSLGSADAWYAWAKAKGAHRLPDVRQYLDTVYEWAPKLNLKAHALVTQSIHETGDGTAGWVSYWWDARCNPAGIGITGDPVQNAASKDFGNGRAAALAHLVHMYLYVHGTNLPAGLSADMDPRWNAAKSVPTIPGQKKTLASFGSTSTTTWAADDRYGKLWANWLNRTSSIFEGASVPTPTPTPTPVPTPGGPPMGMKAYRFVGLDRDVYLPDDIKVTIDIVPDRFIGWVRSGQVTTTVSKTTFHDTGSPGSTARSQRNYLHGGPSENGERRLVGFNFAVDDREIIQLTPLNEVTWAAGTAEGNRTSWHVEQCFGPGIDWDKSLRNAIALHAGLIAAKGWQVDTSLVKHQYWYGKWCPGQVLNKGLWPTVVSRVAAAVAAIRSGGGSQPTTPTAPITADAICAATERLNIRADPTTSSPILYTLDAGQETRIRVPKPVTAEGHRWQPVQSTTEKGEIVGWAADADADGTPWLVVTKPAPKPEPQPEPQPGYAAPLAIAELAPYIGRPASPMPPLITLQGGGIAIPVFDRVRATKETPRMRESDGKEMVGPPIKAGEEFDVSFFVLGQGVQATYVSPYWTRIKAIDCEVISDVPKAIRPAEGQ